MGLMPEVVVVGASVAGSAVAIHLARLGREVLLLDRAAFPRRKACGEGLFPRGVRALGELGALERLGQGTALKTLRFEGYGVSAEADLGSADAPAMGIRRDVLDLALLETARECGVDVQLGRTVHLEPQDGSGFGLVVDRQARLGPRVIVAADGVGSGLRQQAGLSRRQPGPRYGMSAHIETPEAPEGAVRVLFRRGHEVYLTPVGGRCLNVAVLMSRALTKAFAGDPAAWLAQLLERERGLPHGWRLVDAPLVAGPFPVRPLRAWQRNLVLAGDAAGFFDGITGEGMSLALASAGDCARAVAAYLSDGDEDAFRRYERRRRSLGRNSELLGRLTLAMSKRPWMARRAIRGLGGRPDAFSRLVALSSGETGLRGLHVLDFLAPFLG